MRSVDKVPFHVIASDRRKRGNLILHAAQGIEIATARKAHLAMTAPWVFQHALNGGPPARTLRRSLMRYLWVPVTHRGIHRPQLD